MSTLIFVNSIALNEFVSYIKLIEQTNKAIFWYSGIYVMLRCVWRRAWINTYTPGHTHIYILLPKPWAILCVGIFLIESNSKKSTTKLKQIRIDGNEWCGIRETSEIPCRYYFFLHFCQRTFAKSSERHVDHEIGFLLLTAIFRSYQDQQIALSWNENCSRLSSSHVSCVCVCVFACDYTKYRVETTKIPIKSSSCKL